MYRGKNKEHRGVISWYLLKAGDPTRGLPGFSWVSVASLCFRAVFLNNKSTILLGIKWNYCRPGRPIHNSFRINPFVLGASLVKAPSPSSLPQLPTSYLQLPSVSKGAVILVNGSPLHAHNALFPYSKLLFMLQYPAQMSPPPGSPLHLSH